MKKSSCRLSVSAASRESCAFVSALAILFATWERSGSALQASLSGFAFGLGYFLAGVSWVFVSLHYFSFPAS